MIIHATLDKSKIAIITTVINFDLYHKSSKLFPDEIQKYVIDGANGMHGLDSILYMMQILKDKDIKWLIMADEDVLFKNPNFVFDIINKMELENLSVCGVRDGGLISHRNQNPNLINTFFSIINFEEIALIWNKKDVLKNNYVIDNEFNDDLRKLKFKFDLKSLYEPYYCFYLWLRRKKKKILFLDAGQPLKEDEISNAVYFNGKLLLYHTWYARSFGVNRRHTNRINEVLKLVDYCDKKKNNPILYKDKTFVFRNGVRKFKKRLFMRIQKTI